MIWLLVGFVLVALAMMARKSAAPPPDDAAPAPEQYDQLALLQRYGTSDDAARLIADGRGEELAGLGYRPPE